MKVSTVLTASALITVAFISSTASADGFSSGSSFAGMGFGGLSMGGSYGTTSPVPFTRYEHDFRGQKWKIEGIRWTVNGMPKQRIMRRTPVRNSVQFDTGTQIDNRTFNPYDGTFHTDSSNTKVYDSASDAFRGFVDPGSKRYVNRTEYDPRTGGTVRVVGYEWTSFGKYHANLKRSSVRGNSAGDTETHTEHLLKSVRPINP